MKTLLVKVMTAVAVLSAVVAITSPSPAEASSDAGNPGCTYVASWDGFTVTWQGGPSGTKSVVSRKVGARYWWRTAVSDPAGSFKDTVAPKNVGQVEYRIQFKNKSGAVVKTVGCELPSSKDLCRVAVTSTGFELSIHDDLKVNGNNVDYIVRRQVKEDGPYWWRARTSAKTVVDGPSPTGIANYQLWTRFNKRIISGANCVVGEPSFERCLVERGPNEGTSDALTPKTPPSASLLAEIQAVIPRREILDATVAPGGLVHMVIRDERDDGFSDVAVYDPATGSVDIRVDQAGFYIELLLADAAGGTYFKDSGKDGGYIYRVAEDGIRVSVGDIDTNFELIGHYPVGSLPDGTIVLSSWPGVSLTGPGAFQPEPIAGLDTYDVEGVAADGRLLLSDGTFYFFLDVGCVN